MRCKIWGGTVYVPYMVLCVGQACNFKCCNCGNFAPYSPRSALRYSIESIRESLDILFSNGCKIANFQVQGGEPFCYSELSALLEYLGDKKRDGKIGQIVIATNGSIIASNELLALCKKQDVEIRISDYNVVHEKAEEFKRKCEEFELKHTFYDFSSFQGEWYDLGGTDIQRESDDRVVKRRFKHCDFRGCLTLEDGRLAYCSRAVNSQFVQGFTGKDSDYLIISKRLDFREDLRSYLANRHFMEACRYCNGTDHTDMIPPAVQIGAKR